MTLISYVVGSRRIGLPWRNVIVVLPNEGGSTALAIYGRPWYLVEEDGGAEYINRNLAPFV